MHHFDIQVVIHHYGYFGIFSILLVEMIGIPFPAEETLTLSGIEWTQHTFKLLRFLFSSSIWNL